MDSFLIGSSGWKTVHHKPAETAGRNTIKQLVENRKVRVILQMKDKQRKRTKEATKTSDNGTPDIQNGKSKCRTRTF